jgi:protein ImuB
MGGFLAQIRKALFGDEAKMLALVYSSLTRQGLVVNAAIAGTPA